ncbi:MAG: HEAT repeat domain-containing protein [Cyanobacteria bacterium P01_H01_bin.21]
MPPLKGVSGLESSRLDGRVAHWQRFRTGDFDQKWNSSKLIIREGKTAIAPLLELLSDLNADAETHWFTIRALGHFPEPDVIAAIAAQIDNTAYVNRTAEQVTELSAFAIETLAAMGPVAVTVLSQLLEQPQRRLLAAKALNQVRSTGVIPAMVSVAGDNDAKVRYYAVDALGSFHSAAVTPILLVALDDLSAPVRKAAVMALGRRQDLQTACHLSQRLQPLLWDVDLSVSCQTALALGRLGADDSLDALSQVLLSEHTPMPLRTNAVSALKWYCDRPGADLAEHTTQRAFALLNDALKQFCFGAKAGAFQTLTAEETAQIVVAIVRVMGDLRHGAMAQHSTQCLIDSLQAEPAAVVIQVIAMALAGLGQPQAFDALLPLLNHPVDAVLIHTIAALKRLDPDQSFERVSTYLERCPSNRANVLKLW